MGEDFSKMFERLQGFQEQFAKVQTALASIEATGEAGGGMVRATVNGTQKLLRVSIDKDIIDPNDIEMLEDLVVAAVNRAMERARELAEQRMGEATRGMMP